MPGTAGPLKAASTFLGGHALDQRWPTRCAITHART
jgi:hypothetical protein